jgi:putative hydrolase of the HAD superfamily
VKVVLFDIDDTLFAHSAALEAGITAHVAGLGWEPRSDVVERWRALEELHYHRFLSGELDYLGQRRARSTAFAAEYGIELEEPLAWFDGYSAQYRLASVLHADALSCLDALPGTRFGIITNGDLTVQLAKLSSLGILDRFEHVVASGELDFAKPDARIFEHAVALFGVSPADAAYVGDRFETDALGAARAGLTGVWVDRLGVATAAQAAEAATSGVSIVRGLAEVPALLA